MNKDEIRELAQALLTVADQVEKALPDNEELNTSLTELRAQVSRMQREVMAEEVAVRKLPNWAQKLLKVISIKDGDILIVRYHEVATVMQLANVLQDRFDVNFSVLAVDSHDKIVLANEEKLNALGWYKEQSLSTVSLAGHKEGDIIKPPKLAGEIKGVEYKESE